LQIVAVRVANFKNKQDVDRYSFFFSKKIKKLQIVKKVIFLKKSNQNLLKIKRKRKNAQSYLKKPSLCFRIYVVIFL
jgi:hypothetical protein